MLSATQCFYLQKILFFCLIFHSVFYKTASKIPTRLIHRIINLMDKIVDVDIDAGGRFKYILIKVVDKSGNSKLIVRGYSRCNYHADIFDEVTPSIESSGCSADCLGGGRIIHEPEKKVLKVFGYSTGFGKADHSQSVEILKKKYPQYNITWSDEGY